MNMKYFDSSSNFNVNFPPLNPNTLEFSLDKEKESPKKNSFSSESFF